jgi:type I restriction enzyme, R subunit
MSAKFTESVVEDAAIAYFEDLGYEYRYGPEIAHDGVSPERKGYDDPILYDRLRVVLSRINRDASLEAMDEALRRLARTESPSLVVNNRAFHRMLTDGIDVQVRNAEGELATEKVWLFDFDDPDANDWLVTNQFTMMENNVNRRPDLVVHLNGLPVGVIELKNPADSGATVLSAYKQLQTYKAQIPSLFVFNEALVISDGTDARLGSLTAPWERFTPWRTIEGEDLAPETVPQLEVLIRGVFEKSRFLDLIRNFVTFEEDGGNIAKKIAAYHQFHAVNDGIRETVRASTGDGDGRIGVVWHTQGSGKSLTMTFFASKIIRQSEMENPTIVVITDRNDLDDQLFRTFGFARDNLRQTPVQAEDRDHLRRLLQVGSGGVVFTTAQKFSPKQDENRYPLLSDRRNIVVIADEAHRSQYDFIDGFARNIRDGLPKASFIGFTGTPIELSDRNTQAVFGDHISIYDIERAVEDGTTVPIYYEGRLAKIDLEESAKPKIDPEFEDITETEEGVEQARLAQKWSSLEKMVGTEDRLGLVANDIVEHYENRTAALDGKAMIVCMSRAICVDLYEALVKLRPGWDDQDFGKGVIKVVMTGSSSDDPDSFQRHLMTKSVRKMVEKRFKDPNDPLGIVIVRDMWLTGFDVPCLHTMYVDKPMQGHDLMQTIARVNRTFRDKPGGLIVDYLGIAEQLKEAVTTYTGSGGRGRPTFDQEEAVEVMLEKYEIVCGIFHGFDWSGFVTGQPEERLASLANGLQHVLEQEKGDERTLQFVRQLSEAFALSVPHHEALRIKDDVGFFQAIRSQILKLRSQGGEKGKKEKKKVEAAIKQLVSEAVSSDEVIDIFAAAGLDKPDISILSDEFLDHFQNMPQKNLAVEMLRKLVGEEIKTRAKRNLVKSRDFSQMLEDTIKRYQNRTIEAAQVIQELIDMAKQFREAIERGDELGLNDDEVAFYDALGTNDSAVIELGDETLKSIAQDLVKSVKGSVTIDWEVKEGVRAKMRVLVKRILRKYDYPPDKEEQATDTVIEQAELMSGEWAA